MQHLGIFGGTFNPIHTGHLIVAQEVQHILNLDKIIFIPVGNPPHKNKEWIASPYHRYEMVKLAIHGNDKFDISDIEIKRKGMTYTYDTLNELHNIYYGNKFYFILGFDAFRDMETWKRAEDVFKMTSFVVVNRGNIDSELEMQIKNKKKKYKVDVVVIEIPNIDISSTDIRKRIARNSNIKYLVPDKVMEYISVNGLYRGEDVERI